MKDQTRQTIGDHETLLALMQSAYGQPLLVGRLTESIDAGELLAIEVDAQRRPVIRRAVDDEIGVERWCGPTEAPVPDEHANDLPEAPQ